MTPRPVRAGVAALATLAAVAALVTGCGDNDTGVIERTTTTTTVDMQQSVR